MADKTVTIMRAGGTYASQAAAITGEVAANANLVTMAGILHVKCDGDWSGGKDTTYPNWTGFTTNGSYYVDLYTSAACRHQGLHSASYYALEFTNDSSINIALQVPYMRVTGLQLFNTSVSSGSGIYINADNNLLDSCLIQGKSGYGISMNGGGTAILRNSIVYGCSGAGIIINSGTITGQNSTICGCGAKGVDVPAYQNFNGTNCYAGGNTGGDFTIQANGNISLTTCFSSDGANGATSCAYSTSSGAKFTNITATTENFRPQVGSDLIAAGTDLSGTFPLDIAGQTRPTGASAFGVGAWQYLAAGGGLSMAVAHHHFNMQRKAH